MGTTLLVVVLVIALGAALGALHRAAEAWGDVAMDLAEAEVLAKHLALGLREVEQAFDDTIAAVITSAVANGAGRNVDHLVQLRAKVRSKQGIRQALIAQALDE